MHPVRVFVWVPTVRQWFVERDSQQDIELQKVSENSVAQSVKGVRGLYLKAYLRTRRQNVLRVDRQAPMDV